MLLRRYHDEPTATKEQFKDISDLKVAELKELLDEKGIKYDTRARKDDLIELLEGAE